LRTSDERAQKRSCLPADMLVLRDAMLVVFSDSERAPSGTSANPLAAHWSGASSHMLLPRMLTSGALQPVLLERAPCTQRRGRLACMQRRSQPAVQRQRALLVRASCWSVLVWRVELSGSTGVAAPPCAETKRRGRMKKNHAHRQKSHTSQRILSSHPTILSSFTRYEVPFFRGCVLPCLERRR